MDAMEGIFFFVDAGGFLKPNIQVVALWVTRKL
jgi:hypothetical protein